MKNEKDAADPGVVEGLWSESSFPPPMDTSAADASGGEASKEAEIADASGDAGVADASGDAGVADASGDAGVADASGGEASKEAEIADASRDAGVAGASRDAGVEVPVAAGAEVTSPEPVAKKKASKKSGTKKKKKKKKAKKKPESDAEARPRQSGEIVLHSGEIEIVGLTARAEAIEKAASAAPPPPPASEERSDAGESALNLEEAVEPEEDSTNTWAQQELARRISSERIDLDQLMGRPEVGVAPSEEAVEPLPVTPSQAPAGATSSGWDLRSGVVGFVLGMGVAVGLLYLGGSLELHGGPGMASHSHPPASGPALATTPSPTREPVIDRDPAPTSEPSASPPASPAATGVSNAVEPSSDTVEEESNEVVASPPVSPPASTQRDSSRVDPSASEARRASRRSPSRVMPRLEPASEPEVVPAAEPPAQATASGSDDATEPATTSDTEAVTTDSTPPAQASEPAEEAPPPTPNRASVEAAVNSVAEALRACAPDHAGEVAPIRFTFVSTGRVASAVVDSSFGAPAQRSCVARAARGARVPPFEEARFTVAYPFRF